MTWLRYVILTVTLVSCNAEPAATRLAATPAASLSETSTAGVTADDDRCARATFDNLISAVNASDEPRLTYLVSGASLTLFGTTTYESGYQVARLLALGRSGERWELQRLDVNGRGWHGGIDFGVQIRRSGPAVAAAYRDSSGKGVLDCPAGRFLIFGLGE